MNTEFVDVDWSKDKVTIGFTRDDADMALTLHLTKDEAWKLKESIENSLSLSNPRHPDNSRMRSHSPSKK